ncbi:MAG TPA: hypothetical protein VN696_15740 [Pyrinomonadaceae bacterium]|nr:hypothetical protein [Pyrinomonadaceae bacterium]
MRRRVILSVLLTLAASVCVFAQTEAAPRRIIFARGATVARATGHLRGMSDESWFVLRAKSGQQMRVEIRGRGPTRGVLIFPSGKQDGGPGGVIYDGMIDEDGDYKIRVTESMMAEAWKGRFTLIVKILPAKNPTPRYNNLQNFSQS